MRFISHFLISSLFFTATSSLGICSARSIPFAPKKPSLTQFNPSSPFQFRMQVLNTEGKGKGLFTLEPISKKSLIIQMLSDQVMTEEEYHRKEKEGDPITIRTAIRYAGNLFIYTNQLGRADEYINHSFTPSMIYFAGMFFAKRDIASGEELTVNYKYILAQNDADNFTDTTSGTLVDGALAETALQDTMAEFLELQRD